MQSGRKIIAQVAPAFVGQFEMQGDADMLKTALKGKSFFWCVWDGLIGADMGAMTEAEHYVTKRGRDRWSAISAYLMLSFMVDACQEIFPGNDW